MEFSTYSVFFARLLMAICFMVTGVVYARDWQAMVEKLRQANVLFPTLIVWIVIALYIVGSALMVFGYELNIIATAFIAILLLANALYYRFWAYKGEKCRCILKKFMVNLALIGAMMLVVLTNHEWHGF